MIIAMAKVRVMGPRDRLAAVLSAIQDLGVLHLASPAAGDVRPAARDTRQERERRQIRRILDDLDWDLAQLAPAGGNRASAEGAPACVRWARTARRVRRTLERIRAQTAAIEEEKALILKYRAFFDAFRSLLEAEQRWPRTTAYHVLLRPGDHDALPRLRQALATLLAGAFELYDRPLPSGETAVLVVVPADGSASLERLFQEARVEEIPVPAAYGGGSLAKAIPEMIARLGDIPREVDALRREREGLARTERPELERARAFLNDRLAQLDALSLSGVTTHAFVVEGWLPADSESGFARRLRAACGADVVVSVEGREEWSSAEAPVVLSNPRLFRPFELVLKMMPLPVYGSLDPTPFVAIFFPAFFGLMVGDVGYGLVLGAVALVLRWRSRPDTTWRSVSEIAGACALFAVLAGVLFGEVFGDLGARWLGLHPILFRREDAILPFLILSVSIGAVHIVLGLVMGAVSSRHDPRKALGRGLTAAMLVGIIVALLAVVEVLPHAFLTPAVIALLVAFPVLILAEGVTAPIELLSALGNILSYARIMALGVASVMLAVVANQMVGAMGSVAVGVIFALLFHVVNFALALFSPTIQSLRLHYVEFFGKFYSSGGVRYAPFGRWTDGAGRRAT
ncbi:MAG TPA: V-type ATPase 116kDa subunit family protein [Gemmatimonadales bacterium]|nr:V-type ATPase 116kDa subunit family protein [Gemmatimonadales bacterium]